MPRTPPTLALVLVLAAIASGASASLVSGLTRDESRRLEAGQLVVRPAEREKGSLRLLGGTSYQVIDVGPELVWAALLDTTRYPRMMPRVIEARVVDETEHERTVFMRQGAEGFVEKRYYLKVRLDRTRRDMTFVVDHRRPHDLDAAWGFYSVRPHAGGRTLLTYGVMADVGDGLLASLLGGSLQEWMLKAPWMVKRFVEKSGRHVYR
jgi:ribosome-associated toxin RatA of RatAB toxin-antitoxin module